MRKEADRMAEDKELHKLIKRAENAKKKVDEYKEKRASSSWRALVRKYRPIRVNKQGQPISVSTHHGSNTVARHTLKDFKDLENHYVLLDKHSRDYYNYINYRKSLVQSNAGDNSSNSHNGNPF